MRIHKWIRYNLYNLNEQCDKISPEQIKDLDISYTDEDDDKIFLSSSEDYSIFYLKFLIN